MAAIIYEKTPGSLITTGDRKVTTFESGLVRVDRIYVCPTRDASLHRSILSEGNELPDDDGSPSIDGLYIFPAPQESTRGDGFTEFVVSAYGRTRTKLAMAEPEVVTTLGFGGYLYYSVYALAGTAVVKKGDGLSYLELGIDDKFLKPASFFPAFYSDAWRLKYYVVDDVSNDMRAEWNGAVSTYQWTRLKIFLNNITNEYYSFFRYSTPLIRVLNKRQFGEFCEMDIEISINPVDGVTIQQIV